MQNTIMPFCIIQPHTDDDTFKIEVIDYEDGRTAGYSAPIEHNATNISDEEVRVTEIEYKI